MRIATTFTRSDEVDLNEVDRAIVKLSGEIAAPIDLAFVFFSSQYSEFAPSIAAGLPERLGTDHILGCNAESIIANEQEIHMQPALALWAASLPGVQIETCHLQYERLVDDAALTGWTEPLLGAWPEGSTILVLADPFSFPVEELLSRLNQDREGVPVIGGMSSGGASPGECLLCRGGETFHTGAVLARISGNCHVRPLVSQGCRPIGTPCVVTKAQRNEIHELGGMPALERLKSIFETLPTRERQLVNAGPHIGRVVNEYQDRFQHGDFLIRNVIGVDEASGSLTVADWVKPGQTIQFHVRDHETAHVDLKAVLDQASGSPAQGALMFSCNGRGTRLFPQEHHDATLFRQRLGPLPLAGFFAAGEIGPVGQQNFVHGFTASMAIFEEAK